MKDNKHKNKGQEGKTISKSDTATFRAFLDKRGRIQVRQEDRAYLGLEGGELLEVTIKRADIG